MTEPAGHAPLPWTIEPYVDAIRIHDADGDMVCDISDRRLDLTGMPPENARFIVRAVNALPDLLAECEAILPILRSQPAPKLGEWNWPLLADRLEAVIAKAKGVPAPTS